MKRFIYVCFLFLFSLANSFGQDTNGIHTYENHLELAQGYDKFSYYAECVDEINAALELAIQQDWKEKKTKLLIFLAEIKRKTEDHEEGLLILYKDKESIKFPKLHVKKLGRMAALFNEMPGITDTISNRDSVFRYLDSALTIAKLMGLKSEQAGLYNELGYTLGAINVDSSLLYLHKASKLFATLKDTPNYVVVQTNIMRTHTLESDYEKVEPIVAEIIPMIQQKNWSAMGVKLEFYRTLTYYYYRIEDSLKFNFWNVEKYRTSTKILKTANSSELNSFRALYETDKYKVQAIQKQEELIQEEEGRKKLIGYFSIFLILSLGVVFLLFREHKLKKEVGKANDKYHMLIVESNHRIKNNLQMIISMLEYSSKDLKDEDSLAFKKISGKIQTISALHKYLYLDVHNEKVDMETYFADIISLYHNISNNQFRVAIEMGLISIPSERMVYFGLIFNEMLSNTIEHSKSIEKLVKISVVDFDDRFKFVYQDDSPFDASIKNGTGTNLIEQLVKRIEGFNFNVTGETGTYQFEFYE